MQMSYSLEHKNIQMEKCFLSIFFSSPVLFILLILNKEVSTGNQNNNNNNNKFLCKCLQICLKTTLVYRPTELRHQPMLQIIDQLLVRTSHQYTQTSWLCSALQHLWTCSQIMRSFNQ